MIHHTRVWREVVVLHNPISLFLAVLGTMTLGLAEAAENTDRPTCLIGYTEGRNDLPAGQSANWVTNRACLVQADGSGRRVLAEELARKENSWTQFGGWSPDGKQAVILSLWERTTRSTFPIWTAATSGGSKPEIRSISSPSGLRMASGCCSFRASITTVIRTS